jgi:TPR repeat protein
VDTLIGLELSRIASCYAQAGSNRPAKHGLRSSIMTRLIAILLFFLLTLSGSKAMADQQAARPGPGCSGGGVEAERLHDLAIDYSSRKGRMPYEPEKSVRLYQEAIGLGSARSAINLGILYRMMYVMEPNEQEMLREMNRLFQQTIDMGCPDGYLYLAYSYQEGWGVRASELKMRELMQKGC